MTPLEQFNEEVLLKIDKNVDYDEAEIGCNWGVDELKQFITQTLAAHKELILRIVREKAPKKDSKCLFNTSSAIAWNAWCKEFLNNLDTI